VLARALATDPDDRYGSVDEFVATLRAALEPAQPSIASIPLNVFDEDPTNDDLDAEPPPIVEPAATATTTAPLVVASVTAAPTAAAAVAAVSATEPALHRGAVPAGAGAALLNAAGVGRRAAATFIDLIFIFFTFVGMGGLVGAAEGASTGIACAWLVFFALYYPVMERYLGGTLGKLVMGLRVVRADGSPLDWGTIILRNVLRIVDGLFFYLLGAILIWASPTNQRLGDRVAKTLVVNKRALTWAPAQQF
jgi:uncharacterized RDD family membrane protein YckC